MIHTLDDESLLIKGKQSFLLVALVKNSFGLCIETAQDEYVQGVEAGDLVVVSAPEDGAIEPAFMLIDLVRIFHVPLLVLPRDHPGSKRISYVVSVGPEIFTSCSIRRGTHPDQHVICSSDELAGISLKRIDHGVDISALPHCIIPRKVKYKITTDFS
jgi:hypothetical protein